MSGTLKLSGAIKIGTLLSAPSNPEKGFLYYDLTLSKYRQWDGASWQETADLGQLGSTASGKGASTIGIEDANTQFTSENVEGALDEAMDASQAAQAAIDSHENGGVNKHDASEIDVEAADGKNHSAGSAEAVIGELDDALGNISALGTPTNYSTTSETEVAARLAGVDTALASAGGTEFADDEFKVVGSVDATKKVAIEADGLTTLTTRTITMPDTNVDLGDIATNNAKVSASGLVTTHSDVTDAGSGAIISGAERSKLSGIETAATADQTGAEIKTAYEGEANAFTDAQFTKLGGIEALADVTDSTNVNAAGATMNADTDVSSNSWVLDQDNMVGNDATKVPTQQSVKAYVDAEVAASAAAAAAGLLPKDPVQLVSLSNITLSGEQTIDGVLTSSSRILVAGQTDATENGIYDTAAGAYSRAVDADGTPTSEIKGGNSVYVNEGTVGATTLYRLDGQSEITVDIGNQDWILFSRAEAITVAAGALSKNGLELDVDTATTTQEGVVELATEAEVNTGSATNRAVTPASLSTIQTTISNKLDNIVEDSTPQLGGNLDVNGNSIEDASAEIVIAGQNSVRRAKQASKSSFIEEEYIHSTSLLASQTDTVIAALTFAHATVEGMELVFKIKEATSNDIKIGTLRVVTNGTDIVLNEIGTETGDTGITFSAVVNGANINIRYSSGSNTATMRADIKRFLA